MRRLLSGTGTAGFALALCGPAAAQFTQRVSIGSTGAQGANDSTQPSISADGRYVAFTSRASLVPFDTNSKTDVYLRDRELGTTILVSVSAGGGSADDPSATPAISADGRFVAFGSQASNLVAGDTNATGDVFVRDLVASTTARVSVQNFGVQANGFSNVPSISGDGRFIAFWSHATNLVPNDTNHVPDVFLHDRILRTTTRVSVDSSGAEADLDSLASALSADGRYVAFESYATNLVPGDTNGVEDVFVHDRVAGTTTRVSVGPGGIEGDGTSQSPSISADGGTFAFLSWSSNFVSGDTNGTADVFVRDIVLDTIVRANVSTEGAQGNGLSVSAELSGDGRLVAFTSWAPNLVPADTNGASDAFLRDLEAGTTTRLNVGPAGIEDDGRASSVAIDAEGGRVAFDSDGGTLVPGDSNAKSDVFVRDRIGGTHFVSLCDPGVAGIVDCPCGNPPAGPLRGCDNSSATGGASLSASGGSFLSEDTLVFATAGERPTAMSLLLQGSFSTAIGAVNGQGVRCIAGGFRRLFVKPAVSGGITVPDLLGGDPTISARSASVGVPIAAGETRWYMVTYRDPIVLGGCGPDRTYNVTQTGRVTWSP
jgi:Tol biopolymer transport system component